MGTYTPRFGRLLEYLILLLALAVRLERAARETVVNPDVIRFIGLGQRFLVSPLAAIRDEPYHPLHGALSALVHGGLTRFFWADDKMAWIAATKVVGIAAAVAVVWMVMRLSRRMGAPRWAACGAGLLWIVGRRTAGYGADGMSDMLFLALLTGAIMVGMRTRFRFKPMLWLLAGVLAGLSYLTRPEGVAAVLILGVGVVAYYVGLRPRVSLGTGLAGSTGRSIPQWRWRRRHRGVFAWGEAAKCLAVLMLGFLIFAGPYMAVIGRFTAKKSLLNVNVPEQTTAGEMPQVQMAALASAPLMSATGMTVFNSEAWSKLGKEIWETFGFAPCMVVGLALLLRPSCWGRPHWWVLILTWQVLWCAVMFWLMGRTRTTGAIGYLDGRHTLVLLVVLHGLFALALPIWSAAVRNLVRRVGGAFGGRGKTDQGNQARGIWQRLPGVTAGVALGLGCLPGFSMLLFPPARDRSFVRVAAAYLAQHADPRTVVADETGLLAYYAGLDYEFCRLGADDPPLSGPDDPRLLRLKEIGRQRPVILAEVYQTGYGKTPPPQINAWEALEPRYTAPGARGGDVLVLYARPGDGAIK